MKRSSSQESPEEAQDTKRTCAIVCFCAGLMIGIDVVIHGLRSPPCAKYNSKVAQTVAYISKNGVGRWTVRLNDSQHTHIAVRPQNLRRVENAHTARLVHLPTNTERNGQNVELCQYNSATNRWLVKYIPKSGTECRQLQIRPECLEVVRAGPPREDTEVLKRLYHKKWTHPSFNGLSNPSARSYFVTINNPTPQCLECVQKIVCLRIVAAHEHGKTNGVPHVHAIVVFTRPIRRKAVNQMLGGRAWVEPLKGTFQDVTKYIFKDADPRDVSDVRQHRAPKGNVLRNEDHSQQGRRRDLETYIQAIRDGMGDSELVEHFPVQVAKYHKCISYVRGTIAVPHLPLGSKQSIGLWIWSTLPDVGKTTYVNQRWPDAYKKPSDKWWPFYGGQDVAFIDDPNPEFSTDCMAKIKQWCNEDPFPAEDKGTHIKIRFKHLIVCCNQPPCEYFGGRVWAKEQLYFNARFTTVEVRQRSDFSRIDREWPISPN